MGLLPAIHLHELAQGFAGISPTWGQLLEEAGSLCFEYHKHEQGVLLRVQGIEDSEHEVFWTTEETQQLLNAWDDYQELTEFGACGVAILLMVQLTPYTVIRRARKGTGVDYWLGFKNAEKPFEDAARLEVSGILRGSSNTLRARMSQKVKQAVSSDSLPTYVVVVEFSTPIAQVVQQ